MRYLFVLLTMMAAIAETAAQETASPVPTLSLSSLEGQTQSLSSLHGKIVVLNFWATWCGPCREEMPLLVSIQRRYGASGVQVIGASADDESTQAQIAPFVHKAKINFPIWIGATIERMESLGLGSALPATAILDRDGHIVGRILGAVTKDELQDRLNWLLGDRAAPAPKAILNKIEEKAHDHEHQHPGEKEHEHTSIALEGASSVPS